MQVLKPELYCSLFNFTKTRLPHTSMVHLWIHVRLRNFAPSIGKGYCIVDHWPEPKHICAIDVLPEYDGSNNVPILCFWSDSKNEVDVHTFFRKVDEEVGVTSKATRCQFAGIAEYHVPLMTSYFKSRGKYEHKEWPNYMFWMKPEQQAALMKRNVVAPDGYYFDKVRSDEAEFINDVWPHKSHGSVARIERRIRYFPNICLRTTGTNELACFEITHDEHGFMNHLYTIPTHRRKGLATKVEEKLAQILIQDEHLPFKFVVDVNIAAMNMTKVSLWWTDFGYKGFYVNYSRS